MKRLLLALLILLPGLVEGQARKAVPFRDITIERGMMHNVTHGKYGAIPDDGLCDIAAIQLAADSINSQGGGNLFFPEGQYDYDSDNGSIRIYSNTTVTMWGAKFNQIKGGAKLFYTNGGSDIEFIGGEIDGNAINDGNYTEHDHGIELSNAFRVKIRNMYIHNLSGDGVYITDSDYCYVMHNTIISTHIIDSPFIGRNSIAVVEGDHIEVVNNILEGGDPANVDIEPNAGLAITNVLIADNIINGGEYGVSLNGGGASSTLDSIKIVDNIISNVVEIGIHITQASHYTVIGNTVNSSGFDGIRVRSSGGGIKGHFGNISNNDVYNSGLSGGLSYQGILLGAGLKNISVMNNRVSYSEGSGIRIAGGSGTENNWITVMGNICWNNDKNDNGGDAGINIGFTDSSFIMQNICYDNQASPTQAFGFKFSQMDVIYTDVGNTGYGNKTRLYNWANVTADRLNQVMALSWTIDNPGAGASNQNMLAVGSESINQVVMPWDGQIVAMTATTSANLSVETITFSLIKNGSAAGMNSVQLTTSILKISETYFAYTDAGHAFSAGDLIGVLYTTSASYAATTLDHVVTVYIRY